MIYAAFLLGLWFCAAMAAGAALRWSIPTRVSAALAGPAVGLVACLILW